MILFRYYKPLFAAEPKSRGNTQSVGVVFIRMYCMLYCSAVVGPLEDIFLSGVGGSGRMEGGSA